MSTHKKIDGICLAVLIVTIIIALLFGNIVSGSIAKNNSNSTYENKIFDTSKVHTINVVMSNWEDFISECTNEEYYLCDVIIDGESYQNVGIRAKGNTSLTQVESYGNDRYSFKIEFDKYKDNGSYYGLDKLVLNNIIQDNTYMKDYICYEMMRETGIASPLCSFVYIYVNGEEWGLYLAVEGIEESFLERNYGENYGELYKPESDEPGGMDNQSSDVSLIYSDDDYDSYSNIFDNAKTDVDDEDKARLIQALETLSSPENAYMAVDVEQVIKYFVVHNFVCNFDSYTGSIIHNYYLYEQDGELTMIPWDYNLAFGGFDGGNATSLVNYSIDNPVSGGGMDTRPMLSWIFENEEYTQLYHEYFKEFIEEYVNSGRLENEIERVTDMISAYVKEDPTKFITYEEFEVGSETLEEFCRLRAESVEIQLNGDTDKEISADNINISDMGSMNSDGKPEGQNGEMPEMPEGQKGEMPEMPEMPEGQKGEMPEMPEGQNGEMPEMPEMPEGQNGEMPEMPEGQKGEMPEMPGGQNGEMREFTKENNTGEKYSKDTGENNSVMLLAASGIILVAGLIFAIVYKRKGY